MSDFDTLFDEIDKAHKEASDFDTLFDEIDKQHKEAAAPTIVAGPRNAYPLQEEQVTAAPTQINIPPPQPWQYPGFYQGSLSSNPFSPYRGEAIAEAQKFALPSVMSAATEQIGKLATAAANVPTTLANLARGATPESPAYVSPLQEVARPLPPKFPGNDIPTGIVNAAVSTGMSMLPPFAPPEVGLTLPLLAAGGGTGKIAGALYGQSMASSIPQQIQNAVSVAESEDAIKSEKSEAIAAPVISALMAGGMLKHAGAEAPTPGLQGPPAPGALLNMPRGALPPIADIPKIERLAADAAEAAAKQMQREATAAYVPPPTPRAEVPATPAQAYETAAQEARRQGADTINKILKLFPSLEGNRTRAREIRDVAFPEKKGPEYARSQQETAAVHGDLRPLTGESAGQVPVEESRQGVQPQAEGGIPNAPKGQQRVLLEPWKGTLYYGDLHGKQSGTLTGSTFGDYGKGVYVTPDPEFAAEFATGKAFATKPKGSGVVHRVKIEPPKKVFSADSTPLTAEEKAWWEKDGFEMDDVYSRSDLIEQEGGRQVGAFGHELEMQSSAWDAFLDKFGYDAVWDGQQLVLRTGKAKIVKPTAQAQAKPAKPQLTPEEQAVQPTIPLSGTPPTEATPAPKPSSTTLAEPAAQGAEATVAGAISEATPKAPVAQEGVARPAATTSDILGKVVSRLEAEADKARQRLKAKGEQPGMLSGPFDPTIIDDYIIIGASKLARFGLDKGRWAIEMGKEFGNKIEPFIDRLYASATSLYQQHHRIAVAQETPVQEIIRQAVPITEKADSVSKVIDAMQTSLRTVRTLKDHFEGAPKVSKSEVKAADDWLEADANRIKESLTDLAKKNLPLSERGKFLTAINNATKRSPILTGDPATMYRRAAEVAARIENRGYEVRKTQVATEIKDTVAKAVSSPTIDLGYKKRILAAIQRIAFSRPTEATKAALKATRDYIARLSAEGVDVEMPKGVLDGLDVLQKVPAKELPLHVLEALRDRVQQLEQLGRLKVKARQQVWNIEKGNALAELSKEPTNPIEMRPQLRPQPGEAAPFLLKVRNWINSRLNFGSLLDKAILPIDAIMDLLGDAKGKYEGWLFKRFRNPLDLDYNEAEVLRDNLLAETEGIIKRFKLGEKESERIGVYAAAMQEGGVDRLIAVGVKPETINHILSSMTKPELAAYQAMRKAMDSMLPDIQRLMYELYNIEVKPVDNYFPMPRDWTVFEADPAVAKEPKFGEDFTFDDLAGWKQMMGDYAYPNTTQVKRGFTIEREKGVETPIKLNAFDVFHQHIKDASYLLKTQRDLKMLGEIARTDAFRDKYGKFGQNNILSWLDTVARQGSMTGLRRTPMLDSLRKKTSVGVIGFRLASQFVHLSNVPLGIWRAGGPKWYHAGLGETLSQRGQAFLKRNFAETFARGGGEPAIVEASEGKGPLKQATKAGFLIARAIDRFNAQATTMGIYLRLLAEKGEPYWLYDQMPIDRAAQAQALVLARRAVASPLSKDVSPSLSRGAITSGNVSLGRAIFQFQNIFQDQWSNIRHDLAQAGIIEKNPKLAGAAFVAIMTMLLAEMGIRESAKKAIQEVTGYKPKKKEENPTEKIAVEAIRRIPFGGQATAAYLYGQSGIPIVDAAILEPAKTLKTAMTAKKASTRNRAKVQAAFNALQLMGVPGASQTGEIIDKASRP